MAIRGREVDMVDDEEEDLEILPGPIPEERNYYSNSVYCFANKLEVSLIFLRIPMTAGKELRARAKDGKLEIPVVTAVTIPRVIAREVIDTLTNILERTEP